MPLDMYLLDRRIHKCGTGPYAQFVSVRTCLSTLAVYEPDRKCLRYRGLNWNPVNAHGPACSDSM